MRPTPGDPWGAEQHHWNTGAKENKQLNPGVPSKKISNDQELIQSDPTSCPQNQKGEKVSRDRNIEK